MSHAPTRLLRILRLLGKEPLLTAGVGLLVLITLFALLGPFVVNVDLAQIGAAMPRQRPSAQYLLGTDVQGRDILATLVLATPQTLKIGFFAGVMGLGWVFPRLDRHSYPNDCRRGDDHSWHRSSGSGGHQCAKHDRGADGRHRGRSCLDVSHTDHTCSNPFDARAALRGYCAAERRGWHATGVYRDFPKSAALYRSQFCYRGLQCDAGDDWSGGAGLGTAK